ncbi:MAG: hypothetical protein DRQ88_05455 [Epsilonproteobacteria bacterium]|nr:MAG: hypothetical protein DRQ89_08470 [Campylobacterota bacterium]RLA66762.1 MAG: hypothetical protein DRQ88_05455 [Campylobacterota bacterium]
MNIKKTLIFLIFISSTCIAQTDAVKIYQEMFKDYKSKHLRPWYPTTLPDFKLSASDFSRWAVLNKPNKLGPYSSASCFEIILLFAVKTGVVDQSWVNRQYIFINDKIKKKKFGKVVYWTQAWLSVLAGRIKNRIRYIRARRQKRPDDIDWGIARDESNSVGVRIFPKTGDIIFFNPINKKTNRHFDHVALATGRKLTRRQLTGNLRDDNINLEAEILSFYGRGAKKDTLVERDTIEHMLDKHSMIHREPIEGPDRQVFFAPPPWSR